MVVLADGTNKLRGVPTGCMGTASQQQLPKRRMHVEKVRALHAHARTCTFTGHATHGMYATYAGMVSACMRQLRAWKHAGNDGLLSHKAVLVADDHMVRGVPHAWACVTRGTDSATAVQWLWPPPLPG